jgi:hypothetical protein
MAAGWVTLSVAGLGTVEFWSSNGLGTGVLSSAAVPTPNTPAALTNSQIATGNTPVTIASGPIKGGFIINPATLAGQGIGEPENLYIDWINTPGDTDAVTNGTTITLYPGDRFDFPALASGVTVQANAVSAGHNFVGAVYNA